MVLLMGVRLFFGGLLALGFLGVGLAFAQVNSPKAQQLEMEQLQAQVDVMLDEVNDLQNYRVCAEKGKIFAPERSQRADEEGCILPATLPPPTTTAHSKAQESKGGVENLPVLKTIAPTAQTFKLPPVDVPQKKDIPLAQASSEGQKQAQTQPQSDGQQPAPLGGESEGLGVIPTNYPNERVRNLIERAVDQALGIEGGQPQHQQTAPLVQPENTQTFVPSPPLSQSAVQALIPSCRPGEFLTTIDGQVACQRAVGVGKMACPPSTLRVWIDWFGKHMHFHVGYTPHGQAQNATENSHDINVMCDNGTYKLQTVTRNECGGRHCHPSRKPAYSLTYYCGQDNTGRCYAKQNGHLVNHSFTEARITKQY